MPARVSWHKKGSIILFEASDPLTIDDIGTGAEEVWALAAEVREPVDMIFDYRNVSNFPRGVLPYAIPLQRDTRSPFVQHPKLLTEKEEAQKKQQADSEDSEAEEQEKAHAAA